MGWDVYALIDAGGPHLVGIGESFNYTYNTSAMLYEVGINWSELQGKPLPEVVQVLEAGLAKLKEAPEHFESMNPKNGWGSYSGLCAVLGEVIAEFSKYPKAQLGCCL